MEVFKETLEPLQKLWIDGDTRQKCKLVIAQAVGVTELTVREAQEIMHELDRLLLPEVEENTKRLDPGL